RANCGKFSRSPSRISLTCSLPPDTHTTRSGTSSDALRHVAPFHQAANLWLHWVEELADFLCAVRFQHEVGEMTFLRRFHSKPIDIPLDEANPAWLEILGRKESSNRVQLSLISGRTLGGAVGERHGEEHRGLLSCA